MKNRALILVSLVLILLGILAVNSFNNATKQKEQEEEKSFKSTPDITVATSISDKIDTNTIWCGTFQLVWNELKNNLVKGDIIFEPQLEIVENLNKSEFTSDMISQDSYYTAYGLASTTLRDKIATDIKNKFNSTSDILNDFNWKENEDRCYFLYSMLKKNFKFEYAFDILDNGTFGEEYTDVEYFGINDSTKNKIREQVRVLYYETEKSYAVKLKTIQGDEVILCKMNGGRSFKEIYDIMNIKSVSFNGTKSLTKTDTLKIPNIEIREKKEFNELENNLFKSAEGEYYEITKAMQTIGFELNNEGGKVKSEAGVTVEKSMAMIEPEATRDFSFDSEFILFIQESGKTTPYFAAKIKNISLFQ